MTHAARTTHARFPWWLIGAWLLGLAVLFKPWVHGTDPAGYYSWLRSAVIDGNLDTTDEYVYYGQDELGIIFPGPANYNRNPYAIGSALLWLPFFLLAHLASALLGLPADGYAPLYVFFVSLGSALYALAGLWLMYRLVAGLFDRRVAAWSTAGIWWATPLLFYMFSHPIMSHANDAFANALFVYTWHRTRQARIEIGTSQSIPAWLALGAALGLAMLVRTQNALLILIPLCEAALASIEARRAGAARWIRSAALCGAATLAVFAPQMIAWQQTYGTIFPGNPYAVVGDYFTSGSPHFFDVLLSSEHGLFVWSPLVAFAVLGLVVYLPRRDRTLAIGLITAWLSQVYLIGSWSQWSAAASFGQRFMINSAPAYVLGLAALLDRLQTRVNWKWLGASVAVFVMWNLLLMAQYIIELIPRAGPVDLGQMITGQFQVIGLVIERLGDLIAARFETAH